MESAKAAALIAALFLTLGIVGTLEAIEPDLKERDELKAKLVDTTGCYLRHLENGVFEHPDVTDIQRDIALAAQQHTAALK